MFLQRLILHGYQPLPEAFSYVNNSISRSSDFVPHRSNDLEASELPVPPKERAVCITMDLIGQPHCSCMQCGRSQRDPEQPRGEVWRVKHSSGTVTPKTGTFDRESTIIQQLSSVNECERSLSKTGELLSAPASPHHTSHKEPCFTGTGHLL